jgi:hypothetical protein
MKVDLANYLASIPDSLAARVVAAVAHACGGKV